MTAEPSRPPGRDRSSDPPGSTLRTPPGSGNPAPLLRSLTARVVLLILVLDATARQVREVLAAGAQAYLTKPLDVRELLAVIHAHLPSKETADV